MAVNPLRLDPTRTTLLRRKFENDLKRRFRKLKKLVWDLIVVEDAFGLRQDNSLNITVNTRWQFATDPQKQKAFQKWFKEQVDLGILEVPPGTDPLKPWTATYTNSAYKSGVTRAYIASKAALSESAAFSAGSKAQFLESAFGGPIGTKQLEMLATRSFEQLRGITAAMGQKINISLTNGLAHGHSPRKIAREMAKTIDGMTKQRAVVMARTEIVHSYAEGQLDSLEQLGVEEVTAFVEWSTAGDDRVCPTCQPLEGVVMKLKEARGILPRHPQCRCAWIPVIDKPGKGRRNDLQKSINASVKAERRKKRTTKEARDQSPWPGSDVAKPRRRSKVKA